MKTGTSFALVLLAALAPVPARASDPPELALAAGSFTLDRVLHDQPGDGRLWARGASWKASFAPDATTFYPYFGPDAPRHYPLVLRVAEVSLGGEPVAFDPAAAPARSGDTIHYPRGSFTEVYETRLGSIEQLFVFDELERGGELVIRVAAETELTSREEADALLFENARGKVRYSRAVALDARGARLDLATKRSAEGIEIRVPSEFVASARLPLVIDPEIETEPLPPPSADPTPMPPPPVEPKIDVAYDPQTGTYGLVFESWFNAQDPDVFFSTFGAGTPWPGCLLQIDITSEAWAQPAIGYHAGVGQHLVVAACSWADGLNSAIRGRRVDCSAASGSCDSAISDPFVIDSTSDSFNPNGQLVSTEDLVSPIVGGGSSASQPWAVVFQWLSGYPGSPSHPDSEIVAQLVGVDELVSAEIFLADDPDRIASSPTISRASHEAWWNVSWKERDVSMTGPSSIKGCRLSRTGTVGSTLYILDSEEPILSYAASSALTDGTWLAVVQLGGDEPELLCRAIEGDALGSVVSLSDELGLHGVDPQLAQANPAVDADGSSFVVAYAQQRAPGSNGYELHSMTLSMVAGRPRVAETRLLLDGSTSPVYLPSVLAHASAGENSQRFVIATGAAGAVQSSFYSAAQFVPLCLPLYPQQNGAECPCGNPPEPGTLRGCNNSIGSGGALLKCNGEASVELDTMTLTVTDAIPSTAIFVMQGDLFGAPQPFGEGLSCVGGTVRRLYTTVTSPLGKVIVPEPGQVTISTRSLELGVPISTGERRWYFAYYRDLEATCSGTFNTTPAMQLSWD